MKSRDFRESMLTHTKIIDEVLEERDNIVGRYAGQIYRLTSPCFRDEMRLKRGYSVRMRVVVDGGDLWGGLAATRGGWLNARSRRPVWRSIAY